jgi:hypothetical protein
MNSEAIQNHIVDWALAQNFTAPYGVVAGEGDNGIGNKYRSVTFGHARTLDVTVKIFNRNFMYVKSSRNQGRKEVFKKVDDLMVYLNDQFGVSGD